MTHPLQPGDEIHCPHCRRWHPVFIKHCEGAEYTRLMLYWTCRLGDYYAGQIGTPSRHPTRQHQTQHKRDKPVFRSRFATIFVEHRSKLVR